MSPEGDLDFGDADDMTNRVQKPTFHTFTHEYDRNERNTAMQKTSLQAGYKFTPSSRRRCFLFVGQITALLKLPGGENRAGDTVKYRNTRVNQRHNGPVGSLL